MLFDDTYKTIASASEGVFRDRGSKFLGYAYPVSSDVDIKPLVAKLKAEHPKANHHCWAIRLGIDRSVFRVNDDGEPSGTAGRPILNTLLSKNITNVLVVVVRYFGGTLLGVPGLINAYKLATEAALEQAQIVEKTVNDVYTITFEYALMNDVMRIIKEEHLQVLEQIAELDCSIKFSVRKTQVEQVMGKLNTHKGLKLQWVGAQ
ncbi:IMPACT family protein [Mucilaginibacter psychrotolerans]|uniref:YigZ family protein n=1 Tax=Mucilaginibacter psychrotolerans TaxID=1524096 RepID=A0A4Y8SAZ9_9SPHI|nr:YigZ family protein [Mucilaginibacter psychrotolerans]TFF35624.1 YigZ family protein [Mucilaginibacter psychrotolerans]